MDIDEILKDYRPKHTSYQIENFIIGMQGSEWSKYKQCLRELKNRVETLQGLKEELEIKKLKSNGNFSVFAFISKKKRRLNEIRQAQQKRSLRALENDIIGTEKELLKFAEIARRLKKKIGNLNPEKRALLEADSWYQKAKQMAAIDMICSHGISKATFEIILALPVADKNKILCEIESKDPKRLLE